MDSGLRRNDGEGWMALRGLVAFLVWDSRVRGNDGWGVGNDVWAVWGWQGEGGIIGALDSSLRSE